MTKNPVNHGRAKHIDIKYHHIRDEVKRGEVIVEYCETATMLADIMTKGLAGPRHKDLTAALGVHALTFLASPQASAVSTTKSPSARSQYDLLHKAGEGIFMGYEERSKAYRVYDIEAGQVVISRDVTFDESSFDDSKTADGEEVNRLTDVFDDMQVSEDSGTRVFTQAGKRKSRPDNQDRDNVRRPRRSAGLEEASAPGRSEDEAQRKEPKYVFDLFKLDKAEDKLLDSPQFSTWAKYSDDFFKNGDLDAAAFKSMHSSYNDEKLATMILAAEKNPSTKKIAHWTEESLFKGWMVRMTPGDVFRGLHLEKTKNKVFETPLFGYFQKYMDRITEGMRDKDSMMISAMTSGFGDEDLASVLIAAKKVPSTEKLATKLQAGQIHFISGQLSRRHPHQPVAYTWASYLEAFNAKRPLSERESMVSIFRASFSDEELVTMLIAAKEVPSTKKMATDLEAALLNQWVTDREPPAAVSKILTSGGVEDSTKAKLLETYSAKFKENTVN
ncbi:hypothetical protein ON010_g14797 [Phytophthora cinnamomi]|nr:hypothetical protein ON010_g14797 [Phytophthora cinnamomi]